MESFVEFVTKEKIIEIICKKRVAIAQKRHQQHLMNKLSQDISIDKHLDFLFELTPPRRTWVTLSFNKRFCLKTKQKLSSIDYNKKTLRLTIKRDLQTNPDAPYLQRLHKFITEIQECVKSCNYTISKPTIIPKKKKGNECRPIACYNNLRDSILLILENKYLTSLFNPYFYEEALAFRAKRLYHGENIITSHHHSIRRIQEFRDLHNKENIYVAECDMQKFFDTVNHSVVKESYDKLIAITKKKESRHLF